MPQGGVLPLLSEQSRRKRNLVVIIAALPCSSSASRARSILGVRAPDLPVASNIVVIALFNLNLIVFLLLLVLLLFRNLVKLWFERRQKVIGARFKSKLVLASSLLAVTPAILIFIIASNFINKSIEGWFKPQVERPLDQALAVAQTYYHEPRAHGAAPRPAHRARRSIASGLLDETAARRSPPSSSSSRTCSALSTITVFSADGQEVVHVKDPVLGDLATRDVNESQLRRGLARPGGDHGARAASGDLIEAVAPIWRRARRASATAVGRGRRRHARDRAARSRRSAASPRRSRSTSSSGCSRTPSRASTSCSSCC